MSGALAARSVRYAVCEAMGAAIPEGFRSQPPTRPTGTAGTDVPEGVAVDGVAADPAVRDTDATPPDRDRVQHYQASVFIPLVTNAPPGARYHLRGATFDALAIEAEQERLGRLSRWQETRG